MRHSAIMKQTARRRRKQQQQSSAVKQLSLSFAQGGSSSSGSSGSVEPIVLVSEKQAQGIAATTIQYVAKSHCEGGSNSTVIATAFAMHAAITDIHRLLYCNVLAWWRSVSARLAAAAARTAAAAARQAVVTAAVIKLQAWTRGTMMKQWYQLLCSQ
eukprot:10283-Heterococcus_DN1.PRE.1